ncbi:hypothetical protein D3870_07345 [Noviherbaspirillum cavernae]|uniref:MvaI/BcnI restriction endonuclease domain-containing protein n=1 Tax=Noviherbaspirillum cavernae TaxID=2320862 RepID=A0A418X0L0_9BURK|nr:MvaI/BcnI family restriction endonuclease [Noviherbaspirillum cavernae]RJG05855.1 hypothetical protein D3870_07345 [Noviherbaspirillum cavernae]
MSSYPSEFEHSAQSVGEIRQRLAALGVEVALLKMLPKNANDKNQIYIASDFFVLHDLFDMTLLERGESTSETKDRSAPGSRIPEAVFNDFEWVKRDGTRIAAKRMKAIIYPQYPEARLSGLQTVENTIPQSLSVTFTKTYGDAKRLLVLGKLPGGRCVGLVYIHISPELEHEISALPGFERARACKRFTLDQGNSEKLERRLADVLNVPLPGCRLDVYGNTVPFSGTQVCGYTLEHALGIVPNSGSDGDLYGIELKTHTQVKVTLFTPEPDFGLYADDFPKFMTTYGYTNKDGGGEYRLTGIHRANMCCSKSNLTLKIREHRFEGEELKAFPYNPLTPLTAKMDAIDVVLEGPSGEVAAGWSIERLMNCWGAKHNEAVYISATKKANSDEDLRALGYEHIVTFAPTVMWCRTTSMERLLNAINDGVIFLDPAPKFHPTDPSQNKRRAQWRVNDITKAAPALYEEVRFKTIAPDRAR